MASEFIQQMAMGQTDAINGVPTVQRIVIVYCHLFFIDFALRLRYIVFRP